MDAPRTPETNGNRGEHHDREHARAHECSSVLRQHRSRLKTDCGQRDEQRRGGRRQQHQLDPTAHRQVTPIEQQGGKAADPNRKKKTTRRTGEEMIECRSRLMPDVTKKTGMKKP